jgi:hypothetical protein
MDEWPGKSESRRAAPIDEQRCVIKFEITDFNETRVTIVFICLKEIAYGNRLPNEIIALEFSKWNDARQETL